MAESNLLLKQKAGHAAVDFVESGMVIGLGTGSTAVWAVRRLAELLRKGKLTDILAVATSTATDEEARKLEIPVTTLESCPHVDLTIDGADEVDHDLNLIKGAGGALLREKIVAQASGRLIITVDESKLSSRLGNKQSLPVEVIQFGWKTQKQFLEDQGAEVRLRAGPDKKAFVTDQGNFILDCLFGPIQDATGLSGRLKARSGIVEHGLFLRMATDLIVAGYKGVDYYSAPISY
ncbi:MAG: ribose-5-phosphate isomerase RpiA [Desulfobacterales bacterium]